MLTLTTDAGVTLDDPERVLRHSHRRVTRVSVLDELFNPLPGLIFTGTDGYTLEGTINQDVSRSIRRTINVSLANPAGIWTPNGEGSAFYWDRLINVERGVVVGGVEFYSPLGIFLIDSPSVDSRSGSLTLTGADRMDRATRSEFTTPESFTTGTPVGDVIRQILEDAGVGATRWNVNDDGSELGADRHYEIGESRMSAALSLATSFALEVFSDARGYMIIQPVRDPMTLPIAWTFRKGADATHLGVSKRWSRDRFYNHVLVTGEGAEIDPPIRAEASVTDPANPLRTDGPMGDRLFKYTSSMITTEPQALAAAFALLWEHALVEEELSIDHIVNPMLEVGDAINVDDSDSRTNDRYAIGALTLPLGAGPGTLQVKKVRRLE